MPPRRRRGGRNPSRRRYRRSATRRRRGGRNPSRRGARIRPTIQPSRRITPAIQDQTEAMAAGGAQGPQTLDQLAEMEQAEVMASGGLQGPQTLEALAAAQTVTSFFNQGTQLAPDVAFRPTQPSETLAPIKDSQVSTSPIVLLTAGGILDPELGVLDKAAPSSGIAGQDFPLVQLTAGKFGFGTNVSTQFRKVLASANTAINTGILYDPDLIQEGYSGPGIEGNGAFIVKDLADVGLIARANPGADIYYNDPDDIGPPIAVSGVAAFLPALERFLLTQWGGIEEELPQSVIDILVRAGLLEEDGGELFPDVPLGYGGGWFGGGGFGGGGRGRAPSVRALFAGLYSWRISP